MGLGSLAKWVSKDARYKVIEVLVSTRSIKALASELGVSRAAINKYLKRITHPSDETLARALDMVEEYERKRILQILIDDMLEALSIISREIKELNDREAKRMFVERLLKIVEDLS